jgi:hypothetical protein
MNLMAATFLVFISVATALGQDAATVEPLFLSDDILEVELEAPFTKLSVERPDEEEYDGLLRYTTEAGETVQLDIKIRTRGRLRRDKEVCSFPPLRLNFRKSQVTGTIFEDQDKLKLVSHCRGRAGNYEQSIIAEYLAYRIYNLLTDSSYRVRLLRPTYVYSDRQRQVQSFAILIEHVDHLKLRLGGEPVREERVPITSIRREDLNLSSVFHYFIGNTDFSPIAAAPGERCCHNQTVLVLEDAPNRTVPYDFDQSGLVGASYAAPNPRFGLSSVKQRLYRGRCINNDLLPATLELFRKRRSAIESLIANQPHLDKKKRARMLSYVRDFYKIIDQPKQVTKKLITACI